MQEGTTGFNGLRKRPSLTTDKNVMNFMSRDQYKLDCYSSAEEVMPMSFMKTEFNSVLHSIVANATMNNSLGF
jgi:hypothetical protein